MSYNFQTTTHGKWILAGEHAVLRGKGALVFPIKEKKLFLNYEHSDSELSGDFDGPCGADLHILFWSVLEQGQRLLGQSLNHLSGHFYLHSNIPIGVGMGASAALCVAMARWFEAQQLLTNQSVYSFAKNLEDLFHGQSSGLDIAAVASEQGIYFQNGAVNPLSQSWQPQWYLSTCGQIGITSHCINQVKELWEANSESGERIDQQMHDSMLKAGIALETDSPASLQELVDAIQQASNCFKQWGLISEDLHQHMQLLTNAGALAVKPTGAGGGGYVVSLWNSPPPPLPMELIAI